MRLFFLTRSYLPTIAGGTLIRKAQEDFLKKNGFEVIVVTPNYNQKRISIQENIIRIPLNYNLRMATWFERIGIYEDYLDKWAKRAFEYLKHKIKKEDILFATSGGELGNIRLASLLKDKIGCGFVVNFQDPLDYSLVNGLKIDNAFHISREKQEEKYLKNADLVITSSKTNQKSLQVKYPHLKEKIVNNYFGYIKKVQLKEKKFSGKLRIAYMGIFSYLQMPEILAKVANKIVGLEVYFIGSFKEYKPITPFLNNFHFIPFLPHDEFLDFMMENIDVGFVSLISDYLGACVPSKIYEYINLGLPILGALSNGDAAEIINQQGYGIACKYDDFEYLKEAIETLKNKEEYQKFKENILRDRDSWAMEERIKEVILWLRNL